MSFVGSNILAGASGQGGGGYEIERSLRFNSGDSAYLNRTPSSAGNSKTWTLSFWVKRAGLSATNCLFMSYNGSSITEGNYATLEFSSNDSFRVGYAYASYKTTTRVFRDPSSWFHIVVVIDTTNSTAGDRVQIYVNGTKETSFSATQDPDLNQDLAWNKASFIHRLGSEYNQQYSNLYLADIHFIDGQALAPTDFGETDGNGVWQPKEFEGVYAAAYSGTTTSLSQTGWNPAHSGNIWDGNASSASRATGYVGGTNGTVTFDPPLTNVIKVEAWTQNYNHYLNGSQISTPESVNGGWHTYYDNSTGITLSTLGNSYGSGGQTVDLAGIRINGSIVDSQTWTPPSGVGFASSGVNSFHLDFADNSSNAALGTDTSGNSNTWTVNNLVAQTVNGVNYYNMLNVTPNVGNAFIASNVTPYVNTSTWAITDVYWIGMSYYSGTGAMTFTPTTSIPVTNSLIVYFGAWADSAYTTALTITYTDSTTETSSFTSSSQNYMGVKTASNASGKSIQSISVINSSGLGYHSIGGIVVDGNILESTVSVDGDSSIDTPTNGTQTDSGAGGEVVGNYATWNPLEKHADITLSNGNLEATTSSNWKSVLSTIGMTSGKWYWEFTVNNIGQIGVCGSQSTHLSTYLESDPTAWVLQTNAGNVYKGDGGQVSTGVAWATGDIVNIAYDRDTTSIWFGKNGTWVLSGNPASGTNPVVTNAGPGNTGRTMLVGLSVKTGSGGSINFGQRAFAYTAPSGYKCLCTTNLPDPTIEDGSKYFDTVLWSGDGSGAITVPGLSLNNAPGFVWSKTRNHGYHNNLWDAVRGFGTSATALITDYLGSANGGTLNSVTSSSLSFSGGVWSNQNNKTYVAWNWDAGYSNTTIAAGSLNSSLYDQSQTWSGQVSGTAYSSTYAKTLVFDGSLAGLPCIPANGTQLTFTPSPSFSNATSVKIYYYYPSAHANAFVLNGTSVASSLSTGSSVQSHTFDVTGSGFTSLTWSRNLHASEDAGMFGIEVDGKLLVDSGVSVPNVPSIASTVRANPSAGFSIVSYSANNAAVTVGHGLNAAPSLIIAKGINASLGWKIYHKSLGVGGFLEFDNGAFYTASNYWGSSVNSSTFGVSAGGDIALNDMIAYCFSPVEGYSSMGSYTGNGSADGVFIYTGFAPSWLLFKRHDSSSDWTIYDTARDPHNVAGDKLEPNTADAESAEGAVVDILSNGFKFRRSSLENGGNDQYIYMAFAEHPFKTARAR